MRCEVESERSLVTFAPEWILFRGGYVAFFWPQRFAAVEDKVLAEAVRFGEHSSLPSDSSVMPGNVQCGKSGRFEMPDEVVEDQSGCKTMEEPMKEQIPVIDPLGFVIHTHSIAAINAPIHWPLLSHKRAFCFPLSQFCFPTWETLIILVHNPKVVACSFKE